MIRFAKKTDTHEIADLIMVILEDMELPLIQQLGSETVKSLLMQAMANPAYRYGYSQGLVLEQGGEIAGVAFGYPDEAEETIDEPFSAVLAANGLDATQKLFVDKESFPDEWYLDTISVNETYRGQGVGSQLLEALPLLAEKANKSCIGLSVDVANPKAKKLYERQGFIVVGERWLSGHLYEHMQKALR